MEKEWNGRRDPKEWFKREREREERARCTVASFDRYKSDKRRGPTNLRPTDGDTSVKMRPNRQLHTAYLLQQLGVSGGRQLYIEQKINYGCFVA